MTNLLEQIKQDSRFKPIFTMEGENIDNLYYIGFIQEKLTPTTEKEKEIYKVDFKKSEDSIIVRIDLLRNYANQSDIIFVLNGLNPWDFRQIELSKKPIYFTNFEECRDFVIAEVDKLIKQELKIDNKK